MSIQHEPSRNDQQASGNINIQSRMHMVFQGPIFVLFMPLTGIGLFIFAVFSVTHWHELIAMSSSIVAWCLFFLAAACIIGLTWGASKVLLMFFYGTVELYRHIAETRLQIHRDRKVLALHENYAILQIDGEPQLIRVPQEKHTFSHRSPSQVIEEVEEDTPALPAPSQLPTHVRYEDIRGQVPTTRALVGVSEKGIETRDRSIRALLWVVGGSSTGKTNSVAIRVEEDYRRGHRFLVVDPHSFKDDSLYNAIKGYEARFLMPMAQETTGIISVLDFFLTEFDRRKAGGKWEYPVTILCDEVGSLTSFVESEEEEEMVRKLKEVARICGQESRGFDMCGLFVSQDAAGLAWLRKRAIMVLAHQVQAWSERILVCNHDSRLARAMDTWPIGRTLVYGIAFQEGPRVLQQPVFSSVGTVDADSAHLPYMDALPMRNTSQPVLSTPGIQEALKAWEAGATGVRPLMRALDVTYYKASQLCQEMKEKGLID